ncbi:MAG: amino acid ABC transporter substrate-binding protein [Planctomycetota bacterium]|nr:MAG: amino acid ABC transporter substrate-binding protein [Planctomycetota bacterium]
MFQRQLFVTALFSGLLALLLLGCGGRSNPAAMTDGNLLLRLQANGHARVGVKLDTPPFGFPLAGQPAGFDIDVINDVLSRLRINRITYVPVTSANRMDKLLSGEVDMLIASMTITRARDRQVDFSIPYFEDGQGLLVAADSSIQGPADLAGRKVGATRGSTSILNLRQVAPRAELVEYANFNALTKGLIEGEVEAISTDTTILIGLARSMPGGTQSWRLAGNPFSTEPYGIAVPKNQSDLRSAINNALMEMWEDGDFQMLYDTWFGPHTPFAGLVNFGITPYPR